MHRSGTSLLGGILHRLGVELPGNTIAGDHHNPEGYFEWDEVVSIQERLLIDIHRWWPSSEGALALPDGWLQHPATRHAYCQLRNLLEVAVCQQQGLWAIKDPRCSRLLPLWLDLCHQLSIPLRLLLAVRDPAEVAASLVRRDGPLVGMDLLRAQQLWWRHNLEVVDAAHQADLPLAVVDFDLWFQAPERQLDALQNSLPELSPSSQERLQALALINPQYRRSLNAKPVINLQHSVRRLHRRLLRQPFPRRWPSSNPPFASQPASRPDQPELWPNWLVAHRFFPAPRLTEPVSLHRNWLSVCGTSGLIYFLPTCAFPLPALVQYRVDFAGLATHQLHLSRRSDLVQPLHQVSQVVTYPQPWLPPPERAPLVGTPSSSTAHLDPDPVVLLLQALGLPAFWLDTQAEVNVGCSNLRPLTLINGHPVGLTPPLKGHLRVLGYAGPI